MWFKVVFYDHIQPVAAAIGDNFKATDVGRLLGYGNVYNFSYRYGIIDFNTKLPSQMKRVDVTKKCIVFNFSEMMSLIQQKRHKLQTQLNVDDMIDLWINGSVDEIVPMRPRLDHRYGPVLRLGRNKTLKIQDWIVSYRMVLDDHLKKMDDYCYYEQPPSVITHYPQDDYDDEKMIDDPRTQFTGCLSSPMINDSTAMSNQQHHLQRNSQHHMMDPQRNSQHHMMDPQRNDDHQHKTIEQDTMADNKDNIIHLPENPEQLYSLKMDFDAFPPDQIFINIKNQSFKYVYSGLNKL